MERIEDRSKALSYIGIEIAEALKYIPTPAVEFIKEETSNQIVTPNNEEDKISENVVKEIADLETEEISSEIDSEPESESDSESSEQEQVEEEVEGQEPEEENLISEVISENNDKPSIISNFGENDQDESYIEETRFETKPSLWQRIKNSKFVRTISYILKIRVVLDYPALPEGNLENR